MIHSPDLQDRVGMITPEVPNWGRFEYTHRRIPMRSVLNAVMATLLTGLVALSAQAKGDDIPLEGVPAAVIKAVKDAIKTLEPAVA